MNRNKLIIELEQALAIVSRYEGGYSGEFLDAKEFAVALQEAIGKFKAGDDSCVKDLRLWFAPTTAWDDFVGYTGIELGHSIFEQLDKYIKKNKIEM
ncbi:MAG: hypothetical protein GY832_01115 [Chloroflexi bacterium]|nr:hypothetical protein [Chloroflexota bacterium]